LRKVSLPGLFLVIGVLAAVYFLVTLMPVNRALDERPSAQSEQEPTGPADCKNNMCIEIRGGSPRVITRGDITLNIPVVEETWPAGPPREIDMVGVSVCFPGPGNPPPCEDGVPAYGFWLREGPLHETRTETTDEWLARITKRYDGPIEGPVDGVTAYQSKTGRIYVLSEKDAMGYFVLARCFTECRVRNSVFPGLLADYRFPPASIGQWPDLDRAIRRYFDGVRVAE
jgi:hypothetical protein